MNRSRFHRYVLVAAVVVAAPAVGRTVGPARDIPTGTGYAAWDLCTRTMQSGERLDHVRTRYVEPKVHPLPRIWSIAYEPGVRVEVQCMLPTLHHPRAAVFRPGRGCTLVPPGASETTLRAQPFRPAPELAQRAGPWPFGEDAAQSALLGEPQRAILERHAELIFTETNADPRKQLNATALLVAQQGHLVYERYGQGYAREQPQLGWSMTKSLTALIAGLLATDGKIALDAPVGLSQWQGSEKAAITWRQLLNMAPGLTWDEGYGGASDATEMLFSHSDQGAWAAARPVSSKPGTVFTYSTGFTNIAMLAMKQRLGGSHQAIYDFYQSRLFAPLGIRHAVIEPDASGTPVGGARGMLRPVDWLRLGELVANGGKWNEVQLISSDYLKFMAAASPATAAYGGFLWRRASDMIEPELRARLPEDLVWFAGYLGQFVIIVPSQQLVILRMGVSFGGSMEHDDARSQIFTLVADLL